jgi:hypothetical protein
MNKNLLKAFFITAMLLPIAASADNCFIRSHPTSDPAPYVYTDGNGVQTVYLFCTQDKIVGGSDYPIDTIHCYSTTDMFHWKDAGVALNEKSVPWANDQDKLWAPTVYYLKGVYQLICPEEATDGKQYNFTSHAATPAGPFTPATVGELPGSVATVIDPFVFADTTDSIRIWLSYRHQDGDDLGFVRMNDSGTAVTGDINNDIVATGDGAGDQPTRYYEGSWMFKRNGFYFLVYAEERNNANEIIAYSTSHSASGPWTYKGQIFAANASEWTIHSGVCFFKGQWYAFWHNITFGGDILGSKRCTGVEYMRFKNDSTIDTSGLTKSNRGVGVPSAYTDSIQIDRGVINGASTSAHAYNYVKAGANDVADTGWYIDAITNNATVIYDSVNFTPDSGMTGPVSFTVQEASTVARDTIIAYLDSVKGQLLAKMAIPITGSLTTWQTITVNDTVTPLPAGHHNFAIAFKVPTGSNNLEINWVKFGEKPVSTAVIPNNAGGVPSLFSCKRLGRSVFEINCTEASEIRLVNLAGSEAADLTLGRTPDSKNVLVSFDAKKLSSGVYILSVKNRDGLFHHQFVF